jgi:hypothetical protein
MLVLRSHLCYRFKGKNFLLSFLRASKGIIIIPWTNKEQHAYQHTTLVFVSVTTVSVSVTTSVDLSGARILETTDEPGSCVPYKSKRATLGNGVRAIPSSHPRQLYWTGSSMRKSSLLLVTRCCCCLESQVHGCPALLQWHSASPSPLTTKASILWSGPSLSTVPLCVEKKEKLPFHWWVSHLGALRVVAMMHHLELEDLDPRGR